MSDITVYITSDLTSSERKLNYAWTLFDVKQKMEKVTGIPPKDQTIHLYSGQNTNQYTVISQALEYSEAGDSQIQVSSLRLVPYCRLHIVDENPESELKALIGDKPEFTEFELSEQEYQSRANTVLAWKAQNHLGRFDPEFEVQKTARAKLDQKAVESMAVGNRCRTINIEGERRGTIRYVGKIHQLDEGENLWVGIEFDEPVGKNNGLIGDVTIFECKQKHGSFVRPQKVEVGEFPELDPFDEEL